VKNYIVLSSVLISSAAGVASAQQTTVNDRVVKSLPSRYVAPTCSLKPGHFKVSSGATYLKTGIETEIPENRSRALSSG